MLQNLNELVKPISEKLKKFNVLDCPLPYAFTENVKTINKCSIEYGHSASCVVNRNGQRIFLSNNWFYIAAILEPLNKPFHEYKNLLLEIVDKDVLKQTDTERIRHAVNSRKDLSDQDKEYLLKFALEPLWWNGGNSNTGGKTLDRGDALVSAVLSIANLVNASQSYVATLWEFFGENPEYAKMLADNVDTLIHSSIETVNQYINTTKDKFPKQIIYFGSPGTGKSRKVADYLNDLVKKGKLKETNVFRTTFHPDYDFASFIGTYKPITQSCYTTDRTDYSFPELADILKSEYESSGNKVVTLHSFILKHIGYFNGRIDKFNYREFCQKAGVATVYEREISKMVNLYDWMVDNKFVSCDERITYEFEPQVFAEAYVQAWKNTGEQVYLVIEEINRGNCAQIFGDLFQLLDRKDGVSEYPVKADTALRKYLETTLPEGSEGIKDGKLKLPANFNIIATMNTSDQSLFPMDSAFKRRWDWKYVPTKTVDKEHVGRSLTVGNPDKTQDVLVNYAFKSRKLRLDQYEYKWSSFLKEINSRIKEVTRSDDKQLGFWFIKPKESDSEELSISDFVSKVIFYLWNDVFKDTGPKASNPFTVTDKDGKMTVMSFNQFFDEETGQENIGVIHTFMGNLGLVPDLNEDMANALDKRDLAEIGQDGNISELKTE